MSVPGEARTYQQTEENWSYYSQRQQRYYLDEATDTFYLYILPYQYLSVKSPTVSKSKVRLQNLSYFLPLMSCQIMKMNQPGQPCHKDLTMLSMIQLSYWINSYFQQIFVTTLLKALDSAPHVFFG